MNEHENKASMRKAITRADRAVDDLPDSITHTEYLTESEILARWPDAKLPRPHTASRMDPVPGALEDAQ